MIAANVKRNLLDQLRKSFWATFDESTVQRHLESICGRPQQGDLLGQGTHFETFALPTTSATELPKVLKVPRPEFIAKLGISQVRWWQTQIKRLNQQTALPLVPPMALVSAGEVWGLVMPRGEHAQRNSGAEQPLNAELTALENGLRQMGLKLNDVPQLMACHQTTFLVDWSDLQQFDDAS